MTSTWPVRTERRASALRALGLGLAVGATPATAKKLSLPPNIGVYVSQYEGR